jgi:hypothetical protein
VSDALTVISPVVELFGWFGFVVGVPFLLAGAHARHRASRYEETVAVVIPPPAWARAAVARWMDSVETEITVHYDPDRPSRPRTDAPHDDGRALRAVGRVLVGVGTACAVASVALLFVG